MICDQVRKINQELHMLIYRTAEMPLLYQMIRNLWTKSPWDTLYVLPSRAPTRAKSMSASWQRSMPVMPNRQGTICELHIESGYAELE
jgi:hypothetical protein